ncbi:MAG: AsmA family protein, partial [Pseudomonadota bacterium]
MGKIAIGVGGAVVLVIVLLLAAPLFIPASAFKDQIEARASDSLGRQVTVGDELSLSLFPQFKFAVTDLTIANAPNMSDETFASVARADIGVNLLPLLGGRVAIDRFVLIEPTINLERNAAGEVNWMLVAEEQATAQEETGAASSGDLPGDINLGDVRLVDGQVRYRDAVEGVSYDVSDINLDVALKSFSSPLTLDGDLVFQERPVALDVNVSTIRAIQQGKKAQIRAKLSLDDARVAFSADTIEGDEFTYTGDIDVNAPSVRGLLTWFGQAAPMEYGFGPLEVAGDISGDATSMRFEQAKLRFDDMRGGGRLAADWASGKPSFDGALALDALDLRPYMPPPDDAADQAMAPWSTETIDFSGMGTVDLNFEIETDKTLVEYPALGAGRL